MKKRYNYDAYSEYQKSYHQIWLEEPGNRDKWNTYQRARAIKQNMIREISNFFKGQIQSHIRYDEPLDAYKVTCLFKRLSYRVSKIEFRRIMEEKGYTVDFDGGVTVSVNYKVTS